jgi:phage host-nuclease inhibitor protein Gam
MALYTYDFCYGVVNGGWDSGIINNLEDAKREIKQNFEQMDFENASVQEDMQALIDEMIAEIDQLIATIQAVQFE